MDRQMVIQKPLVSDHARLWARNKANINKIRKHLIGVYVLCDGSMPVYVGKGKIHDRIDTHDGNDRIKKCWDHFSWFAVRNPEFIHDLEALIVRMLPPYCRSLNERRPNFKDAEKAGKDTREVFPAREFSRFANERQRRKKR